MVDLFVKISFDFLMYNRSSKLLKRGTVDLPNHTSDELHLFNQGTLQSVGNSISVRALSSEFQNFPREQVPGPPYDCKHHYKIPRPSTVCEITQIFK